MIDEKVLIETIKHHKENVVPIGSKEAEFYKLAHDHIIELVNILPKVGGWILCSERLPENFIECLVTLENGAIFQAKYVVDEFKMICTHEVKGFYKHNKVIAWMPLPEPYDANAEAEKPQWQQQMMDRFMKGE